MNSYDISFRPEEVIQYLRKSRSDDPNMTIEEVLEKHEHMLRDFAVNHFGAPVPDCNVYREVASSETIDGRPEMLRLLRAIESPDIRAVLVIDVQRLSRGDLEDAGRLMKLLRYTNTQVITPMKTYDLRDEWDRDIFERELKRGNEYLEYFKKIQARGRLQSVQEGNYLGSKPPYGYDRAVIRIGKKNCPTLAVNKEQADVVRLIYELYVNKDWGAQRIANHLDSLGIHPLHNAHWNPAVIKDILRNYHYIGKVVWNRRKTITVVDNQEVYKTRPWNENMLIFDGRHEAIISEELFHAALARQGRSHRCRPDTRVSNVFASILHCSCGYSMSLRHDGRGSLRLSCDDQRHCKSGSIGYEELIDYICKVLTAYIDDFKIKVKHDNANEVDIHRALVSDLEARLAALEAKEVKQWEVYSMEGMPRAIFDKLNKQVKEDKAEVERALKQARKDSPDPVDYRERIAKFGDALNALQNPAASAEIKNQYLKAIINDMIYTRPGAVRLTADNCSDYGINYKDMAKRGGWYSPPFRLEIKFRF